MQKSVSTVAEKKGPAPLESQSRIMCFRAFCDSIVFHVLQKRRVDDKEYPFLFGTPKQPGQRTPILRGERRTFERKTHVLRRQVGFRLPATSSPPAPSPRWKTAPVEQRTPQADLMIDKQTKKKLKNINKEIKKLKKQYNKLEFKPCKNDAELKQKDEDLKQLRAQINRLDRELNYCVLNPGLMRPEG